MTTASERPPNGLNERNCADADGKAVFETEWHRDQAIYCIEALRARFAQYKDTYVSGGNYIYYKEGDTQCKVSPDCYVVSNVEKRLRDAYRVWEEGGHTPDVIFEFTSNSTRREDAVIKRRLYEQTLRVKEYFLFDPKGDCLEPRLQGARLQNGRYEKIEMDDLGRIFSDELCVYLWMEDDLMRIADSLSLDPHRTPFELAQLVEEETIRADAAEDREIWALRRAEDAEAEIARLRAQIEAMQKSKGA